MSYRPTIGGKLRGKLPEQTGHRLDCLLGHRPRQGDWSDLWIERHREERELPRIGVW
jgi:hypothetical protein